MNPEDFESRLMAWLDDELSSTERRHFEAHLASHERDRARAEEARRFNSFVRGAVRQEGDQVQHARVMSRFQRAVAAENGAGGSHSKSRFRPFVLPAAAAAILVLLWSTGLFAPRDDGLKSHLHDPVLDLVLVQNRAFEDVVIATQNKGSAQRGCIEKALEDTSPDQCCHWEKKATIDRAARAAEAAELFKSCTGRVVPIPSVPANFELIGARVTNVPIDGTSFPVPHVVFYSAEERLSVYIFCRQAAKMLRARVPEAFETIHGCTSCGVVARERGEFLLLVVSDASVERLESLVRDL